LHVLINNAGIFSIGGWYFWSCWLLFGLSSIYHSESMTTPSTGSPFISSVEKKVYHFFSSDKPSFTLQVYLVKSRPLPSSIPSLLCFFGTLCFRSDGGIILSYLPIIFTRQKMGGVFIYNFLI
jgi:hypothetical protein